MAIKLYRHEGDNGRWGFVDEDGDWVIKPKFSDAEDFSDGFAAVKLDGKWGYIKSDGKWLVEPRFYDAGPFEYGIAVVEDDDFYVIDKTGKRALAPGEKLSLVKRKGYYGLGVFYDDSETESRIRWVIKPQFDKGFEWDCYIVVGEDLGLWSIISRELGVWEGHYGFIEENDDDYCLDCYSDGNVLHFYPDGIHEEDEDDNEYEDDDE